VDIKGEALLERPHGGLCLRPEDAVMVSVWPLRLFLKLIWSSTARTVGPVLPIRTVMIRARQVAASATPLAARWRARWNAITAFLVGPLLYKLRPNLRPGDLDGEYLDPARPSQLTKVPFPRFFRPCLLYLPLSDTSMERGILSRTGGMAMYDKILVAIDHSEISDRVLMAARDLALLSKGEVWVLHLLEREVAIRTGMTLTDESMDEARASVAAAVDKLTAAGVKAHGDVGTTLYGYAARSIVEDATEHDVGVIVMGSRGRGDLAGLILGSTTHKVIHLTDRPVLIVR